MRVYINKDWVLECPDNTTISQLKELIQEQYPTHPHPSLQRLLHKGRLVETGTVLEEFDLLLSPSPIYVIKFVCLM